MLVFIGLGLSIKHLTIEAIKYLNIVDKIIVDTYTGITEGFDQEFIKLIGRAKEIVFASRSDLEGEAINKLVEEARHKNIAILVSGDPFIATTHDAIRVEALRRGVKVVVVNGLTIYSLAVSRTGLQVYRFGKTVTLVYPDYFKPYSTIEAIYDNLNRNLHTLVLLDFRRDENKYMSIPEAIDILLDLDEKDILANVVGVGLARIGFNDEYIVADKLAHLRNKEYPKPPHAIIVVAKPHPIELDNLRFLCKLPKEVYEEIASKKTYP